jgi:hypothetical protein
MSVGQSSLFFIPLMIVWSINEWLHVSRRARLVCSSPIRQWTPQLTPFRCIDQIKVNFALRQHSFAVRPYRTEEPKLPIFSIPISINPHFCNPFVTLSRYKYINNGLSGELYPNFAMQLLRRRENSCVFKIK